MVLITQLPPSITNLGPKIVAINCARFVLNCAGIVLTFFFDSAPPLFEISRGWFLKLSPLLIANLGPKIGVINSARFVMSNENIYPDRDTQTRSLNGREQGQYFVFYCPCQCTCVYIFIAHHKLLNILDRYFWNTLKSSYYWTSSHTSASCSGSCSDEFSVR